MEIASKATSNRIRAGTSSTDVLVFEPPVPAAKELYLGMPLPDGKFAEFLIHTAFLNAAPKPPDTPKPTDKPADKPKPTDKPKPPDTPRPHLPLGAQVVKPASLGEQDKDLVVFVSGKVTAIESGQLTLDEVLICTMTTSSIRLGQTITVEGTCFIVQGKPKLGKCKLIE